MVIGEIITHEELLKLLHYDPESGTLTWRRNYGRMKAGDKAGTQEVYRSKIKCTVYIENWRYIKHRLIWFYMTGKWPPRNFIVAHLNSDPLDFRWVNLELKTKNYNTFPKGGSYIKGVDSERSERPNGSY